jgi:tryptophan-rich sensory protein
MIGVAGFRTFESRPRDMVAKLWIVQMVLNFAWSPIFFSLHRVDVALAVIISLFATVIAFILRQWSVDRLAAGLFIPYAAWMCFATILNGALFILN